jgi:phosphatidylinositol dimannoside acyltransferase
MKARLADRLTVLGYSGGWSAVRHLPDRVAYATFRNIADLAWRRRGPSVRRLEANLARALGTTEAEVVRDASRAGMRSYLRYWCDAFRLPDWSVERIVDRVRIEGEDNMRTPLAVGRGAVAALPHMANWDHPGSWACLTGAPVTTVAERLEPEALFARFLAYREGLGMEILPLTGGPDVFTTLATRLREARLVPLLADRDLSRRGVEVQLLGESTRMPAGPAALALRTGAALLPTSLWYEGVEPDHRVAVRFHDEVLPPEDLRGADRVVAMTQAVADVFSTAIAAHPHDWHMLQPLFLSDLGAAGDETDATARARR